MCYRAPLDSAVCIHCGQEINKAETLLHQCSKLEQTASVMTSERQEQKKQALIKTTQETIDYLNKTLQDPMKQLLPKMQNVDYSTMTCTNTNIYDCINHGQDQFINKQASTKFLNKNLSIDEIQKEIDKELVKIQDTFKAKEQENLSICEPGGYYGMAKCNACNKVFISMTMVVVTLPSNDRFRYCTKCWLKAEFPKTKEPQTQTNKEPYTNWDPEDDTFLADA